jgi:hypothetical protein
VREFIINSPKANLWKHLIKPQVLHSLSTRPGEEQKIALLVQQEKNGIGFNWENRKEKTKS